MEHHLKLEICCFHKRTGRVSFGELKSLARMICFPLLARKSSGLPKYCLIFLPEHGYLKNSRGGGGLQPLAPRGRTPMCFFLRGGASMKLTVPRQMGCQAVFQAEDFARVFHNL